MPRLTERDDGFYLDERKVRDGDFVERREKDTWVRDRIHLLEGEGDPFACFGSADWIEDGKEDPHQIDAAKCELRWPVGSET